MSLEGEGFMVAISYVFHPGEYRDLQPALKWGLIDFDARSQVFDEY